MNRKTFEQIGRGIERQRNIQIGRWMNRKIDEQKYRWSDAAT